MVTCPISQGRAAWGKPSSGKEGNGACTSFTMDEFIVLFLLRVKKRKEIPDWKAKSCWKEICACNIINGTFRLLGDCCTNFNSNGQKDILRHEVFVIVWETILRSDPFCYHSSESKANCMKVLPKSINKGVKIKHGGIYEMLCKSCSTEVLLYFSSFAVKIRD